MTYRLFNFFVDNDDLFGKEFKTSDKIPKTVKLLLQKGLDTKSVFDALEAKNKLEYSRECYKLCIKKDDDFAEIDSIEDPCIIYYVLLHDYVKTGADLHRDLLNYEKIENLNEKLNSQIISLTGILMDVRTMVVATGHPLVTESTDESSQGK